MLEVKQRNASGGQYFFDTDTMRFFNSRVSNILYGGRYFVTSERCGYDSRLYTVREALLNGTIATHVEFGQYRSRSGAHARAKRLAETIDVAS